MKTTTTTAFLLLLSALPAQVVTLANHTPNPWTGWRRLQVDQQPQSASGVLFAGHADATGEGDMAASPTAGSGQGIATFKRGRRTGLDTWAVDINTTLQPGQTLVLDLASFSPFIMPAPQLPSDLVEYFGDWPKVNGATMAMVSAAVDGAGWSSHFRARIPGTRLLLADLWVTWYPGQFWAQGEALITASNPAVTDLVEPQPSPAVNITFGDAVVTPMASPVLLAAGTPIADGQARAIPLMFAWRRHIAPAAWIWPWGAAETKAIMQILSSEADKTWLVRGIGISQLLADGNPTYPASFAPLAWATSKLRESERILHTYDWPVVGVIPISGTSGEQEDEVLVRGEALLPGGIGAELIGYLGALEMAKRPCNHREVDGTLLDPARHTGQRLVFWDGRVHPSASVSPERLGKLAGLTQEQASGWWGPDVEHWLINTLAASARLIDSPCLQELLRAQATVYMLQQTTSPALVQSTSITYASRAVGWEGINAVHLWRVLEDRALADRVRAHWLQRFALVIQPAYANLDVFDMRTDDARLGDGHGQWWMVWQQGVACYGLDLAGRTFGVQAARDIALRGARKVVQAAIYLENGRWRTCEHVRADGLKFGTNIFWMFGTCMAPAVILRADPTDATARAIWNQLLVDATEPKHHAWLPPGVPQ